MFLNHFLSCLATVGVPVGAPLPHTCINPTLPGSSHSLRYSLPSYLTALTFLLHPPVVRSLSLPRNPLTYLLRSSPAHPTSSPRLPSLSPSILPLACASSSSSSLRLELTFYRSYCGGKFTVCVGSSSGRWVTAHLLLNVILTKLRRFQIFLVWKNF